MSEIKILGNAMFYLTACCCAMEKIVKKVFVKFEGLFSKQNKSTLLNFRFYDRRLIEKLSILNIGHVSASVLKNFDFYKVGKIRAWAKYGQLTLTD